jgi:putative tricarboxylic transport membrane protein
MIPGIGATAAAFISYTIAHQFSSKPRLFHHGNPEGIIASEAAINAKEPGGLMPMLAFGIPGSIEAALVLGAFIFHGIEPGPFLLRDHPGVVWALLLSLWVSNVFGTLLGVFIARWLAKVTTVRVAYLAPIILVCSLVGTYLWRGNVWDMFVAIGAGACGYFLAKAGFSVVTLVIGYLLGDIAERAFFQSMQISDGNALIFVERPTALAICGVTLLFVALAVWRSQRFRARKRRVAVAA